MREVLTVRSIQVGSRFASRPGNVYTVSVISRLVLFKSIRYSESVGHPRFSADARLGTLAVPAWVSTASCRYSVCH